MSVQSYAACVKYRVRNMLGTGRIGHIGRSSPSRGREPRSSLSHGQFGGTRARCTGAPHSRSINATLIVAVFILRTTIFACVRPESGLTANHARVSATEDEAISGVVGLRGFGACSA